MTNLTYDDLVSILYDGLRHAPNVTWLGDLPEQLARRLVQEGVAIADELPPSEEQLAHEHTVREEALRATYEQHQEDLAVDFARGVNDY